MEENKFVVKDVSGVEKSKVEIEEKLLKEHEEKFEAPESKPDVERVDTSTASADTNTKQEEVQQEEETQKETTASELNDADVLSYIKNRYDRDIESVDQLLEVKESNPELPEDVSAYFKYKKETGRRIEDFDNLQKDYDNMNSNTLLSQYYAHTEEGLDSEDIKDLIEDKFTYDEDVDEESDIKKIERAKKRELAFLRMNKEMYDD